MDDDMKYRGMLLELDKCLNQPEFESLLFLCKDQIKKREREKIKRLTDLWEHLETRELLGPRNLQFLKELIDKGCDGRLDVKRIIENYESSIALGAPQGNGGCFIHAPQPMQIDPAYIPKHQPVAPLNQGQRVQPCNYSESLRKEINFVTKHLGREWRFFMRALGVSDVEMQTVEQDYPRSLRDQIYECLVRWINEKKGLVTREVLVSALKDTSVERYDLASQMEMNEL